MIKINTKLFLWILLNKEINDNIKIVFISAHANLDLSATISGIKCAVDYYAKPISADKYKHLLDQYYYKK